jgi:hypothetical protein
MAVTQKFKLVQNDQMPEVWLSLTDDITKDPIDVSALATAVYAHIREVGQKTIKATLLCDKMAGVVISIDDETGAQTISLAPPYDTPGRGGRVAIAWDVDTLDKPGVFQAEIEVVFEDGKPMTWYDVLQFNVREQFA